MQLMFAEQAQLILSIDFDLFTSVGSESAERVEPEPPALEKVLTVEGAQELVQVHHFKSRPRCAATCPALETLLTSCAQSKNSDIIAMFDIRHPFFGPTHLTCLVEESMMVLHTLQFRCVGGTNRTCLDHYWGVALS